MKKLLVLSVDALVYEDIEFLRTLPNFRRYMSNCAQIEKVKSIYPTITYPVHTSIVTGVYPDKHGILLNGNFEVGNSDWNWFNSSVKADDIFKSAKDAGLSTAAVFWPVTGNHKYIDYLIDEYWTQGKDDTVHEAFKRSGSNEDMLKIIDRHAPILVERRHPMCDNFALSCACDIIRDFAPDLMMIHPANVDGYRHSYGVFNEYVRDGIIETDKWIGQLIDAMREAGVYDDTNFVIMSDHGQLDMKRIINLNVYLADEGLIKLDENGRVVDWDAYVTSGGCCAFVCLKDKNDEKVYNKVYDLLKKMVSAEIYGISEVFTRSEISEKEHLDGDFSFVVETDGYTAFGESAVRPVIHSVNVNDYRYGRATHGYLPDKGPQPVFLAKGPAVKENVILERGRIIDMAPTFAKILGLEFPNADGKPICEVLK